MGYSIIIAATLHEFLNSSLFAGTDHLRTVFGATMGLSDKDIVALSGGHTLVSVTRCSSLAFLFM